ncbi:hypothetical protein [Candidatus Uabimicrobium amorphum]|uniref:Uncharacterized protein n=1 Tax=Uabimicrobium amorphum TaxID=2596890 RepID=A0A5S9F5B6_UABAM|nr:hypothetical protein [Candidatus Uabimicrobium amorphum]BBM85384.1 hypothetical protein UABAM_03751 [Candidatus Uabimicrobium amorphum]
MNDKQFEQYLQTFEAKPSPALRRKIFGTQNYWSYISVAALFVVSFCGVWFLAFDKATPQPPVVAKAKPQMHKARLSYMRRQVIVTGEIPDFTQKDSSSFSRQLYKASSRNLSDFSNN